MPTSAKNDSLALNRTALIVREQSYCEIRYRVTKEFASAGPYLLFGQEGVQPRVEFATSH